MRGNAERRFRFRLALALHKSLGELERMPQAEYLEWQEFAALEPFGAHYDDLRAGAIVSAVYNVNRDPKEHPNGFGPLEFMRWNSTHGEPEPPAAPAQPLDPEALSRKLDAVLFGRAPD